MLNSFYEIWHCDHRGYRRRLVHDALYLEYHLIANDVGTFKLGIPLNRYRAIDFRQDDIVEIWRHIPKKSAVPENAYFLSGFDIKIDRDGMQALELSGPDINDVANHYRIKGDEGSTASDKDGYGDDLILTYAREAFGPSADADRKLSDVGVSIQPDLAAGVLQKHVLGRKLLFDAYKEICETSATRGTKLFWRFVPIGFNPLQVMLRTFIRTLGRDRTRSGMAPVVLSVENGTLANVRVFVDYNDQVNVVYAGGSGGANMDRLILEDADLVKDTTRILSPWGRREDWYSNQETIDQAKLLDEARSALNARRPRLRMQADFNESNALRYGYWGLGDAFLAIVRRVPFIARAEAVSIRVDAKGEEIRSRLDGDMGSYLNGTGLPAIPGQT